MRLPIAAIAAVLLLCSTAQAADPEPPAPTAPTPSVIERRAPTNSEARAATHYVLDGYARLVGDGLLVGAECLPVREHSRVCMARAQNSDERWRVVVTVMPGRVLLFSIAIQVARLPRRGDPETQKPSVQTRSLRFFDVTLPATGW